VLVADLGASSTSALAAGVLFAFASIAWPFAHISFDVTPTSLFLLLAFWCVTRIRRARNNVAWALAGGLSAGWAIMMRIDSAFPVIPITAAALYLAWTGRHRWHRAAGVVAAWTLPLVFAGGVYWWYNWLRFGSAFNSGHNGDPNTQLNGSLLGGFAGQLVSPGRGLIVFSPLVLLALLGWRRLWRIDPHVTLAAATAIIGALLVHARLANWSGEDTWGPRYLVPVAGLALVPLGHALDLLRQVPRQGLRASAGLLVAVAIGVQVVGASTAYYEAKVDDVVSSGNVTFHSLYWTPAHAQLYVDARDLYRGLSGDPPYLTVDRGGRAPAVEAPVDWWWANNLAAHRYEPLALITVPLCLLLAVASSVVLRRRWWNDGSLFSSPGPVRGRRSEPSA